MPSVVEICNRALGEIGTRSTIASLNENSNEARYCSTYYEAVRDQALGMANWNFAEFTTTLALLKAAPGTPENPDPPESSVWSTEWPRPPWLYEYSYPSGCVRCRYIIPQQMASDYAVPIFSSTAPGSTFYPYLDPIKFVVATDRNENDDFVKVILTNQGQAIMVYTAVVIDPNQWDPEFIQVVVNALAGKLAIPLTGDKDLAKLKIAIANDQAMDARASNGNEGLTVQESMPDWIRIRGVGSMGPGAALQPYSSLFTLA